jgi:hypothetical protein
MQFRDQEIENDPQVIRIKTTAQLLSAARREFLNRKAYDGPQMLALTLLFDTIAREVHQTRFQWSDYNRAQWDKFVNLRIGSEGGACAFSLESGGDYKESYDPFKGIFVGVPTGVFPYSIAPLTLASNEEVVAKAVSKAGYTLSE